MAQHYTRRSLLQRSAKTAAAFGFLPLLGACQAPAPAGQPAPPGAVGTAPPQAAPPPTQIPPVQKAASAAPASSAASARKLTVALSSLGTAQVYLPWHEAGAEGWIVMWGPYEGLASVSPLTQKLEPMLAERWEQLDGGKRWEFYLRKGVPFHDNHGEFSAEDVKFTFDQITSATSLHSGKGTLAPILDRIEVTNPNQVTFLLKQPYPFLPELISLSNFYGVVSKSYVQSVGDDQAAAKPVGTGPFKVVGLQRLHSASFEAVPNHWRVTPEFQTLELLQVGDPSARLDMLRAGQADVIEMPFKLQKEAEGAGARFIKSDGAALYHLNLGGQVLTTRPTFDPAVPWVGDPNNPTSQDNALKVRRALALAIDKQAIIDSVFRGQATPLAYPFLGPSLDFLPKQSPYPFDPPQAKQLLAEAGYAGGFGKQIEMLLQPWPGRPEMALVDEAVAGFWEQHLGLQVKRTPMDFATWAPIGRARNMAWRTWAQGVNAQPANEPALYMATWISSTSSYNTLAERSDIDALYARISSTLDVTQRHTQYSELAKIMYDGYYGIPIAAVPSLYAVNPKVVAEWPRSPGEAYLRGYEFAKRA